jgi:pheromone shutdown protein TraB
VELQNRATLQRIVIPTAPGYYTTVYLLGTSHVSNDSSADVNLLLYSVRPSTLLLLLSSCRSIILQEYTFYSHIPLHYY